MARNKKAKDLAQKLYQQGITTDVIAESCQVSRRTVQRWIKEFEKPSVTIVGSGETTGKQEFQSDDVVKVSPTTIVPTLENVANLNPGETVDLKITSRLAIRLLNLTQLAVSSLEDCLTDPNARRADKLKAVQLIGDWMGLTDGISVLNKLASDFDLEIIQSHNSLASFTPKKLLSAQKESEIKIKKQILSYNQELSQQFAQSRKLPDVLDEKFDASLFLNWFECDEDEDEDEERHSLYIKAKNILQLRGYSV